jgi:hypothetical protein
MKRKLTVAAALVCSLSALVAHAGGRSGSDSHVDIVLPYSTDTYHVTFRGGQTASVVLSGDGDTDLDLYVYDENGFLIARDDDLLDDCIVVWVPRRSGTFTIKVVNRGSMSNIYAIAHN